jgi:cobalt/nickel transport protein
MAAQFVELMRRTGGRLLAAAVLFGATPASAHFGMVIASDPMVAQQEDRTITLELSFSHPFEATGMDLAKPRAFGVSFDGVTRDLRETLTETTVLGGAAWQTTFTPSRPGTHVFYMEPEPYWEPAEDVFIVHHTKTYVAAFGDDSGWDAELGLATEIVPLSRPFGLWEGNVFQGIVKVGGDPVPFAEVEIERYNSEVSIDPPSDLLVTQTIKADANGVFTYAAPGSGWWGFAALTAADYRIDREGNAKKVELGAVLWVHFEKWPLN